MFVCAIDWCSWLHLKLWGHRVCWICRHEGFDLFKVSSASDVLGPEGGIWFRLVEGDLNLVCINLNKASSSPYFWEGCVKHAASMMAAACCNCIVFWCFLQKVCPDVCCMQYRQGRCLYDFYMLKLTWVSKQQKTSSNSFRALKANLATSTSGPSWGLFEGYLGCGTERCREFGGGEVAQEGLAAKVIIETHSWKFFLGWEGGRGLVPRSHIFMAQQTMAKWKQRAFIPPWEPGVYWPEQQSRSVSLYTVYPSPKERNGISFQYILNMQVAQLVSPVCVYLISHTYTYKYKYIYIY